MIALYNNEILKMLTEFRTGFGSDIPTDLVLLLINYTTTLDIKALDNLLFFEKDLLHTDSLHKEKNTLVEHSKDLNSQESILYSMNTDEISTKEDIKDLQSCIADQLNAGDSNLKIKKAEGLNILRNLKNKRKRIYQQLVKEEMSWQIIGDRQRLVINDMSVYSENIQAFFKTFLHTFMQTSKKTPSKKCNDASVRGMKRLSVLDFCKKIDVQEEKVMNVRFQPIKNETRVSDKLFVKKNYEHKVENKNDSEEQNKNQQIEYQGKSKIQNNKYDTQDHHIKVNKKIENTSHKQIENNLYTQDNYIRGENEQSLSFKNKIPIIDNSVTPKLNNILPCSFSHYKRFTFRCNKNIINPRRLTFIKFHAQLRPPLYCHLEKTGARNSLKKLDIDYDFDSEAEWIVEEGESVDSETRSVDESESTDEWIENDSGVAEVHKNKPEIMFMNQEFTIFKNITNEFDLPLLKLGEISDELVEILKQRLNGCAKDDVVKKFGHEFRIKNSVVNKKVKEILNTIVI